MREGSGSDGTTNRAWILKVIRLNGGGFSRLSGNRMSLLCWVLSKRILRGTTHFSALPLLLDLMADYWLNIESYYQLLLKDSCGDKAMDQGFKSLPLRTERSNSFLFLYRSSVRRSLTRYDRIDRSCDMLGELRSTTSFCNVFSGS